jgi:hypothetical protein
VAAAAADEGVPTLPATDALVTAAPSSIVAANEGSSTAAAAAADAAANVATRQHKHAQQATWQVGGVLA